MECFSEKAAPTRGTVQLPSGESTLVAACDVSQTGRAAISEALSDNPAVDRGSVGVSITTSAPSGDLIGYGFAVYRDERGPYFTSLNLTDPGAMVSSNTVFTGIPAGQTSVLQRTFFKPELAVSNFSTKSAQVSITLATTTASKTRANVVKTLLLPPQSSKTVKLQAEGDPGMTNSLVVHSNLPPGEVVSQFVAWGDSLVRTVELQAKDNDSIQNGGGHPWSLEHGTNSTLFWFNHSTDGPKKFELLIGNGKELWVNTYLLAPMETKAININEIVEKQIPDPDGTVLSKDILTGQVGWWTHRAKWGKGRLMVSQPQSGLARSFSCGTCAGLCADATLSPASSAIFGVTGTGPLGAVAFKQCLKSCTSCGGTPQGPITEIPTWSSSDTSITTLYSGQHTKTGTFYGVKAGFASGEVQATDEGCTAFGSGQVNVRPTISGPNTVWWFNGETQTGYATGITLTASGGSSYQWTISKGSNMIKLSNTTGASPTVNSTGSAFSSTATDISVTVTSSGTSSTPFYITSRRPYLLVVGTITDSCGGQWGYSDYYDYTIKDQMGSALPNTVQFNEYWTTPVVQDYPNNTWIRRDPLYGLTDPPAQFTDELDGAGTSATPPTACPGVGQAVNHWGQEWFVGSLIPGVGVGVQTDIIQKETNQTVIENITSPVP